MKIPIIIFGLLYAVYCKPALDDDSYTDEFQNDDNYTDDEYDQEEVPEENVSPNLSSVTIGTVGKTYEKNLGESVILPCKVTGQDYVLIWRKNGAVLYQAEARMAATDNMKKLTDGSLEISDLKANDSGDYECTALITQSYMPAIKHTLKIITPPHVESLTTQDNVTILKSGDTLILTCNASGYPKPVISWHKGKERLSVEGESLKIPDVKHHNAGEYRCLADNKIGDPSFKAIHIKVEYKPVIEIDQISVNSEDEEDTELKCTVHAEPKPQVVWKKDGINIKNTQRTQLTNNKNVHVLVIKNLMVSDFGVYTCFAANSIGSATKNVSLVKTPAVVQISKPRFNSRDVILTWYVRSKSPISEHELEFRKKGESDWRLAKPEVSKAESGVYTVEYELTGLDPGTYEARTRSQNSYGWSDYFEIKPFQGVYAKHGHHKVHKKGHKDHKDIKEKKQVINTQEINRTTQSVKSLNSNEPTEYQENVTIKIASFGANESSGSSSLSSTMVYISITLIILQIRTSTARL